jgi:hypothetical protein
MYALQLERYLQVFSSEQILVVDQADLLADRRSTLREIFGFLSVDGSFGTDRFDKELYKSEARRAYPPGYAGFLERNVVPHLQWLPARLRRSLRHSAEQVLLPSLPMPVLDVALQARLRKLYADDVERLRKLTGKEFSTWNI